MIYIDFPGGAHGHFLEFIISKHVMRVPEYENFLPFTTLGTSHVKLNDKNRQVFAAHITEHNLVNRYSNVTDEDLVIDIFVSPDSNELDFIFYGNLLTRVADGTFDLEYLEKNTLEKLTHNKFSIFRQTLITELGDRIDYPRAYLRNILYSQIREIKRSFVIFAQLNQNSIRFNFSSFYNWPDFLSEINRIAKTISLPPVDEQRLFDDHELFLKNNAVYGMKNTVMSLLDSVYFETPYSCKLNILEEAFLNALITDKFNIHSGLRTFADYYSADSVAIASEIKQILNERNPAFSQDLPIGHQFDKIVLEF